MLPLRPKVGDCSLSTISFFFIGTLAFVGLFVHPSIMFIFTIFGMLVFFKLGFLMVSLSGLIGIFLSMIFMIIKLRNNQ